ncbi:transcriptional regulator [Myxococcus stipitatus]|uniref:transcriptional regulator n=1 Tax=Myxococcus stipitatus TaxID=83455 RepID=UPI001F407215|nr:transcriptional regulator [Myxococcus stipitatus]MCE9667702.1 transcriptional regulator [Myxococcus stipitatus]
MSTDISLPDELIDAVLGSMTASAAQRLRAGPGSREGLGRVFAERASLGSVAPEPFAFARHLGARLAEADDPARALERLHARDLALALACAQELPGAADLFEDEVLSRLRVPLSRLHPSPAFVDEVLQTLRANLLMPRAGAAPRLAGYAGVGSLFHWVNSAGVRLALRMRKAHGQEAQVDAEVLAAHPAQGGLELGLVREDARAHVRAAFVQAVASLDDEDRELLRLHFVERLSLERMGALYGLHKSTLSRRLSGVQAVLEKRTRRVMSERLALSADDLDSVMRAIHGRLDLSLSGLLAARE